MPLQLATNLAAALGAVQALPTAEPAVLETGVAVRPPPAFIAFCETWPEECRISAEREIAADARTIALLAAVNVGVNRAIVPLADPPGRDVWRLDATHGDCDDYAVAKRHALMGHGLPASALRLAVTRTAWGERHLVLVVRTDRGDLVLDNLTDAILPVDRTGLVFETMQRPDKPRGWAAVAPATSGASAVAVTPAGR